MLLDVFEYFDKDGNGYLQAYDLKEIFEHTDISDENFQTMIDEIDQNGDRKISFKEFFEIVKKMRIYNIKIILITIFNFPFN